MERNNKGQFVKGKQPIYPVGTIRVRTRKKRNNEQRAYIKVENPNKWVLNCIFVWESMNGKIPIGLFVHHIDGNKLNDSIENLSLVSKKQHLEIHRPAFKDKALKSFIEARRKLRWSTKKK